MTGNRKYGPVHPTQTGAMSCGLCKRNEGNLQKEKRVKEGISPKGGKVFICTQTLFGNVLLPHV